MSSTYCKERQKQLLFHKPPPRFNLLTPYNGIYTQTQLDMRRKGEILKYKNNASSTKTNNFTKAQKWAQVIKGKSNTQKGNFPTVQLTVIDYMDNYQTINIQYPNTYIKIPTTRYLTDSDGNIIYDNFGKLSINKDAYRIKGLDGYYLIDIIIKDDLLSCSKDELIPTPTSACNVPGPITYLINDETVPLYNYNNNIAVYSYDVNYSETEKWLFNPKKDLLLNNGDSVNIFSFMVTNLIDQLTYTYSLEIPFSMYVSGSNISTESLANQSMYPIFFPNLAIGIKSIEFHIKYADNDVVFLSSPIISINNNYTSVTMVNNDGIYNTPTNMSIYPLQFDISFSTLPQSSSDSYYTRIYSGVINISNILLRTEPGYVYDFYLKLNTSDIEFSTKNQKSYYESTFLNTDYGFFINSTYNSNISNNCVTYSTSTQTLMNIKLTGS